VHVHADLFTAIELCAVRIASTIILVTWLFRHVKREVLAAIRPTSHSHKRRRRGYRVNVEAPVARPKGMSDGILGTGKEFGGGGGS